MTIIGFTSDAVIFENNFENPYFVALIGIVLTNTFISSAKPIGA